MKSIYVEIASLEDTELANTVIDISEKCSGKYSITVGIYLVSSDDFLKELAPKFKDIENILWYIKHDPVTINTLGITKGRKSSLGMYNEQDYVLQIDAHTKFEQDWDKKVVEYYEEALKITKNPKTILTAWLGSYSYNPERYVVDAAPNYPMFMLPDSGKPYSEELMSRVSTMTWHFADQLDTMEDKYVPLSLYCGNFMFGSASLAKDLYESFNEDLIFVEEELLTSIELKHKGYTFAFPNFELPLTHSYDSRGHEMGGSRAYLEMYLDSEILYDSMESNLQRFYENKKNQVKINNYAKYAGLEYEEGKLVNKKGYHIPDKW
jgi:hypothetical protein